MRHFAVILPYGKKPEAEMLGLVERTYHDALQLGRTGAVAEAFERVEVIRQKDAVCFPFERVELSKRVLK